MAGYGNTIPKPDGERRRRNKRDPETRLPPVPPAVAPKLPPLGGGRRWATATRRWWQVWVGSPQSSEFLATDWVFLAETAALVDAFWKGDATVAAEIRLRVAKLGATVEDRRRLRMTVAKPEQPQPEGEQPASRYAHLRPA